MSKKVLKSMGATVSSRLQLSECWSCPSISGGVQTMRVLGVTGGGSVFEVWVLDFGA